MGRTACAGLAAAAGDARARRQEGRPRRGDAAQHAGGDRRHAGRRLARRDLVVLLARFRRAGRARPFRPDRAGAVHRLRRLLVQRQAERRVGQGARRCWRGCRACAAATSSTICAPPQQAATAIPRAVAFDAGDRAFRAGRARHSSSCRSPTRSTSCSPPARPAFPNASCIRPAARCSSISRSTGCMPTSGQATACSISPPAAG